MSEITSSEYFKEVRSLAESIAVEAMEGHDYDRDAAEEEIYDTMLYEAIDGHLWIIYTAYHLDVIRHSDNADYYMENFGIDDAADILKERGIDGLHAAIAFWALYADVQDRILAALDEIVEAREEKESASEI